MVSRTLGTPHDITSYSNNTTHNITLYVERKQFYAHVYSHTFLIAIIVACGQNVH